MWRDLVIVAVTCLLTSLGWLIQRRITKAKRTEGLGHVKSVLEVHQMAKDQGLATPELKAEAESAIRELTSIRRTALDPAHVEQVAKTMEEAIAKAQAGGTVAIPAEEVELAKRLIRVLFNQVVEGRYSALHGYEWLQEHEKENAAIVFLRANETIGLLKVYTLMRIAEVPLWETENKEITKTIASVDRAKLARVIEDLAEILPAEEPIPGVIQDIRNDLKFIEENWKLIPTGEPVKEMEEE